MEDGQQVVVPGAAGAGAAAPARRRGASSASARPTRRGQLDELDGIGPTLAQRIVEYRTEHGGFRSLGELREVEGIGEKRLAALREALQP